jgi:HSP20 family protein
MLDTLKETSRNIGNEIGRAWDVVSEGWHELFNRSSNALTHFGQGKEAKQSAGSIATPYPRWSMLAGEVEETDKEIVVRLEVPGIEKENCRVTIDGNRLFLSGEKRFERSSEKSSYHVMERAYGAFQRIIPLPKNVREDQAEASYSNGVLTVRLPKLEADSARSIPVS